MDVWTENRIRRAQRDSEDSGDDASLIRDSFTGESRLRATPATVRPQAPACSRKQETGTAPSGTGPRMIYEIPDDPPDRQAYHDDSP
ncbi:hypothetical protein Ppa06_70170 [Planomonospora parontospora subsp. parontospora]|uniref:Uncharacterized protein n=2 Tax=Planomonospora parontospora TaxID=58119 RepID=A0AA37BP25_9ACTN|nr:hypothetical protein GCM10010126_70820 [Planomonospora parontospora]GII13219.1 hypothetical protein Ppa06_70170 [Planomonospora parontospora subsp. parontospora]